MPGKGSLQARIFVCRNALADHLRSKPLQQLRLTEVAQVEAVPCLGKIDPRYLLKAFEGGCDAVCLIGCPIGKCRTMDGNLRAQKRVALVSRILDEVGIKGERLAFVLREPMEEPAIEKVIEEFIAAMRSLGPSELKISGAAETI